MIIEIKRIMKTRLRLGAILHFIIAIGHIACLFFLEEAFKAYFVVSSRTFGVVLFTGSNEKCTYQSVEFIKEWDFHRSLISTDVGGSLTNGIASST